MAVGPGGRRGREGEEGREKGREKVKKYRYDPLQFSSHSEARRHRSKDFSLPDRNSSVSGRGTGELSLGHILWAICASL